MTIPTHVAGILCCDNPTIVITNMTKAPTNKQSIPKNDFKNLSIISPP
ncbi:hypothetical protein CNEO4_1110005 [Clostridium neonatale]|nr:hypothetical protein CNEO4_1110005 [Clostridium neonatale]CAI3667895.1 hypothetical protein CNEO4_530009 [Clostridium neonatale]